LISLLLTFYWLSFFIYHGLYTSCVRAHTNHGVKIQDVMFSRMRSRSMNLIGCSSMLLRRKVHLDPNLIGCFRMLLPLCATFHPWSIEKGIKLKRPVPKKIGLKYSVGKALYGRTNSNTPIGEKLEFSNSSYIVAREILHGIYIQYPP